MIFNQKKIEKKLKKIEFLYMVQLGIISNVSKMSSHVVTFIDDHPQNYLASIKYLFNKILGIFNITIGLQYLFKST